MNKLNHEYENEVEVTHIRINEIEYSERVRCVIKCLLEMSFEGDKTEVQESEAA